MQSSTDPRCIMKHKAATSDWLTFHWALLKEKVVQHNGKDALVAKSISDCLCIYEEKKNNKVYQVEDLTFCLCNACNYIYGSLRVPTLRTCKQDEQCYSISTAYVWSVVRCTQILYYSKEAIKHFLNGPNSVTNTIPIQVHICELFHTSDWSIFIYKTWQREIKRFLDWISFRLSWNGHSSPYALKGIFVRLFFVIWTLKKSLTVKLFKII